MDEKLIPFVQELLRGYRSGVAVDEAALLEILALAGAPETPEAKD